MAIEFYLYRFVGKQKRKWYEQLSFPLILFFYLFLKNRILFWVLFFSIFFDFFFFGENWGQTGINIFQITRKVRQFNRQFSFSPWTEKGQVGRKYKKCGFIIKNISKPWKKCNKYKKFKKYKKFQRKKKQNTKLEFSTDGNFEKEKIPRKINVKYMQLVKSKNSKIIKLN